MKKTALPRSKAKNAYDLLGDVIQAITEEPKRILMTDWVTRGTELRKFLAYNGIEGPSCGTVGCIAGWCAILVNPRLRNAEKAAHQLLGNVESRYNDAFSRDVDDLFTDVASFPHLPYGTKPYANQVAKNIRAFRKKWRTRLLATPIAKRKTARRVGVRA